ncbi:hypothetical protein FJ960_10360 [Mesorhizobium sp. B2-3-11]|nr:hypothetical protein FJ960_10360 [Mesorhizobium sp. B2-3-11]
MAATVGIPSRPPLSCRTSPPRGRRSAVIAGFIDVPRAKSVVRLKLPISPSWAIVGEMPGRQRGALSRQRLVESGAHR